MKCFVCQKDADETTRVGGKDVCGPCEVETFTQENMCLVTYAAVIKAQGEKPFFISTQCQTQANALAAAINRGIDSRLQAVSCDSEIVQKYIGDKPSAKAMQLLISPATLPVLIRRLFEGQDMDEETFDAAHTLGGDIMNSLGFDDTGKFVGREALGLE
jgi:hypothetical protein